MKRFLTLALTCLPLLCIGAPTYTTYFNNTHTYTNSTVVGTNFAGRGVFTNGITAGASTFTGAAGFADGTAGAPSIGWTSDADGTGTGIYRSAGNRIGFSCGGALVAEFVASNLRFQSASVLEWNNDTILLRDAANTLALRNSTAAQTFNIYGTYTDASNYERAQLAYAGGAFSLAVQKLGTGGNRDLELRNNTAAYINFYTSNTLRWKLDPNGHFLANADNTYDIGASGATRPRHIYVADDVNVGDSVIASGNLQVGAAGSMLFATRSRILSPADGQLHLRNAAGTDFDRLQFGGTSASFPAEKRSGTGFIDVLADDSGPTWRKGIQLVSAKTADYPVVATDSKTVFTNEGTTAIRNNTLPGAAAGLIYTFIVQDTDGLTVTAAAGDTIRIAASVSADAGNITTTTVGNTVTIVAINATEWIATSVVGTWTVN